MRICIPRASSTSTKIRLATSGPLNGSLNDALGKDEHSHEVVQLLSTWITTLPRLSTTMSAMLPMELGITVPDRRLRDAKSAVDARRCMQPAGAR
jgi:hypothetical protein